MTILRAGLYERVSTEEQVLHGYSIETQIDTLAEYCEKHGYKVVDHYTDEGISGAKSPLKRPALKRLLDDVIKGRIDIVIFTKLDRWFRSVQEYFKVQEILEKHNVEWKAIHEDYDTTTANGRMAITIFLAIAQNEREKTSERLKVVFKYKIKNKEAYFGGKPPLGYTKKEVNGIPRWVKNPEEQQATAEFWDIVIKTGNLAKAARHMSDVYGIKRSSSAWARTIRQEVYCGYYRDIENFCEPYITREQWEAVLAARPEKNKKTGQVYLFSGMIRCPECGRFLIPSTLINPKGTIYHRYSCKYTHTNACSWRHYVAEIKTEKYLLQHIEHEINSELDAEAEKRKAKITPKTNIAALKEQLHGLNVMYVAGNMSDDEYLQEAANLKGLIAKAEKEVPPPERDLGHLKAFLSTNLRDGYEKLSPEGRRKLWCSIIKEIVVEKNEVKRIIFL